jgi:hypothetical protein
MVPHNNNNNNNNNNNKNNNNNITKETNTHAAYFIHTLQQKTIPPS